MTALRVAILLALAAPASAQPTPDRAADQLAIAAQAAESGDWPIVERIATPISTDQRAGRADRGEAHRLLALAAYHRRRVDVAEAHFLAYLRLDLDGRLDPSLYAPELVAFFENVRATHAAELRALRPRPRRAVLLNLIPPAGQFQNRQPVKGWILGGVGAGLLAANLSSYIVLRRWCDESDQTCEPGGQVRSEDARTLITVNTVTGVAFIAVYAYGVFDGFRHYRRAPSVIVTPISVGESPGLGFSGRW